MKRLRKRIEHRDVHSKLLARIFNILNIFKIKPGVHPTENQVLIGWLERWSLYLV